jgi:mRNA interferase MazF
MRGDLVTVSIQGDYGKPRPAVVVQADRFINNTQSLVVLLLISDINDAPLIRVTVQPSTRNGLRKVSQIMVDKIITKPCEKIGKAFGHIEDDVMQEVDRRLAMFLGITK